MADVKSCREKARLQTGGDWAADPLLCGIHKADRSHSLSRKDRLLSLNCRIWYHVRPLQHENKNPGLCVLAKVSEVDSFIVPSVPSVPSVP